ncbi:hypothetical protein C0J52_23286 [Blattella germanica]|nr:hypothetical protein C0J52_23286 [Blattella germanica]
MKYIQDISIAIMPPNNATEDLTDEDSEEENDVQNLQSMCQKKAMPTNWYKMAPIMNRYCENCGIEEVWEAECPSLVPERCTEELTFVFVDVLGCQNCMRALKRLSQSGNKHEKAYSVTHRCKLKSKQIARIFKPIQERFTASSIQFVFTKQSEHSLLEV